MTRPRAAELAAVLSVVLFAVASVRTFFREGLLPGWDHPVHFTCSYLTSTYFFPKILGWDPYNNFGWVFNQFYNPGAYVLVALIYRLALGRLSVLDAYKLALVVTYALPGLGAYALAKSLGGDALGAVMAAFLSVVVLREESEWLDAGLKQLYYIGMWPHRLGVGFALLALAFLWSSMRPGRRLWLQKVSLAALFTAAAILSHPMTAGALLIAEVMAGLSRALNSLIGARPEEPGGRLRGALLALASLAASLLLALSLTAFWLVPLARTNDVYHNLPTITWHVGPKGVQYFVGTLGGLTLPFALAAIALSAASAKGARRLPAVAAAAASLLLWALSARSPDDGYVGLRLLLSALLFLFVSSVSESPEPALVASVASALLLVATGPESFSFRLMGLRVDLSPLIPYSDKLAYYKFAGLARYLILTVAGMGVSRVTGLARKALGGLSKRAAAVAYVIPISVAAALLPYHAEATDLLYPQLGAPRFRLDLDFPGTRELLRVIDWVGSNVPPNTYVFYQDTLWKLGDWNRLPVSHYFYISSLITGKPQVGGCFGTRYITHPLANSEGDHLLGWPIDQLVRNVELLYRAAGELGVSYLVIFDGRLVASMRARPDLFREVYSEGPFHVFETMRFNPIVSIEGGEVMDVTIRPNLIRVSYTAPGKAVIRIRQVYYPGWRARIDGLPAAIRPYYPDARAVGYRVPFIEVEVPPGTWILTLSYELDTAGDGVSAVTLALLAAANAVSLMALLPRAWRPGPASLRRRAL